MKRAILVLIGAVLLAIAAAAALPPRRAADPARIPRAPRAAERARVLQDVADREAAILRLLLTGGRGSESATRPPFPRPGRPTVPPRAPQASPPHWRSAPPSAVPSWPGSPSNRSR